MNLDTTLDAETSAISRYTPLEELPQFLTVDEWRCIVNLSRSAAYAAIRAGYVRAERVGRKAIRIPKDQLLKGSR